MPKTSTRASSKYSQKAVILLGKLIRQARIERRRTAVDVASRANISRGLLQRIEKGDLGCAIGSVFEVAAILGVRLFDADVTLLTHAVAETSSKLALLPKAIRNATPKIKDDF